MNAAPTPNADPSLAGGTNAAQATPDSEHRGLVAMLPQIDGRECRLPVVRVNDIERASTTGC